ncbi:BTB/POZ domain with WD40/YVTN repeat-like protein [Actinidia rufa]|uniref:BTB/POZ domain with WD40/YVTN repeat-like protein n=1 Tax=Actinidia rufa TaxID=165716 RepID=A0A7J0DYB9_9ERIC|nr:BTB/POZ domain with WD40/YVTN repeat-like protein [Actinidia rufa]
MAAAAGAMDFFGLQGIDLDKGFVRETLTCENVTRSSATIQAIGSSPEYLFTSFEFGHRNLNSIMVYDLQDSFRPVTEIGHCEIYGVGLNSAIPTTKLRWFSSYNMLMASGSHSGPLGVVGNIKLWDIRSGTAVWELKEKVNCFADVTVSNNLSVIYKGGVNSGEVFFVDLRNIDNENSWICLGDSRKLHYFIIISLVGYLALKVSKPRTGPSVRPKELDLFFTSVSAATVSSMSTVEMEVFSNTQPVILTILMLVGGEVFNSLLGLQLMRFKFTKNDEPVNQVVSVISDSEYAASANSESQVELVHVSGYSLISVYIILVPSASQILKNKGLSIQTFSVFTTVTTTFANGGFIPTNENMMVFINNSGLLLLLIPQVLLGNILFALCLRFVIWALEREEFSYILKSHKQLGYDHLLSCFQSLCLTATTFGLILVQFILFYSMEWTSKAMEGLNSYHKLVGSLFQVVSSRHSGESVVDLYIISPANLVLFIVMM